MSSPITTITYTNARTGGPLVNNHVDKGQQAMLADGLGRTWVGAAARGFAATPAYDALHRPVSASVVAPTGEGPGTGDVYAFMLFFEWGVFQGQVAD